MNDVDISQKPRSLAMEALSFLQEGVVPAPPKTTSPETRLPDDQQLDSRSDEAKKKYINALHGKLMSVLKEKKANLNKSQRCLLNKLAGRLKTLKSTESGVSRESISSRVQPIANETMKRLLESNDSYKELGRLSEEVKSQDTIVDKSNEAIASSYSFLRDLRSKLSITEEQKKQLLTPKDGTTRNSVREQIDQLSSITEFRLRDDQIEAATKIAKYPAIPTGLDGRDVDDHVKLLYLDQVMHIYRGGRGLLEQASGRLDGEAKPTEEVEWFRGEMRPKDGFQTSKLHNEKLRGAWEALSNAQRGQNK